MLYAGLGFLLGLVTGWPESTPVGVVWGSILASIAVEITSYFTGDLDRNSAAAKFILLMFLLLPVAGAAAPFLYLLRKAIDHMIETYKNGWLFLRAAPLPLLLAGGMLALASLNLIAPAGRTVLPQMHACCRARCRPGANPRCPPTYSRRM